MISWLSTVILILFSVLECFLSMKEAFLLQKIEKKLDFEHFQCLIIFNSSGKSNGTKRFLQTPFMFNYKSLVASKTHFFQVRIRALRTNCAHSSVNYANTIVRRPHVPAESRFLLLPIGS